MSRTPPVVSRINGIKKRQMLLHPVLVEVAHLDRILVSVYDRNKVNGLRRAGQLSTANESRYRTVPSLNTDVRKVVLSRVVSETVVCRYDSGLG